MGFNFGSSVQVTPTSGGYLNSCATPGMGVFLLGGKIYSLLYSSVSKKIGFWVSADSGATWVQLSQAGPFPSANSPGQDFEPLYFCFDGIDTAYIVVDSPVSTHMQVWAYTISTDTWAQFGPDLILGPAPNNSQGIFVFPNGNVIVFLQSGQTYGIAPFPSLYYCILSGGAWSTPFNLGSILVPAPTGNTDPGPFVDGAMIGGALGNVQNYANPFNTPNYVFGVSISNAGVTSDVANSLITAIGADALTYQQAGFVSFAGKIYGLVAVNDSTIPSFLLYLVSFDGTNWVIVSTQTFASEFQFGALSTDGTNLYYTYVDFSAPTPVPIHLMSSADGGLTWSDQVVPGDATFVFTQSASFVPHAGLAFYAEDPVSDFAFFFVPLVGPAPRALRGSAGGSTTQPRCCDRPWSPILSEKLTEPDLAVPIQGQRVCFPAFLASPTDALVHVIGQYQVPQGYWFQLDYLVLNYLGAGWTPGDGNVTFSLDVNTTANPNAQGIPVPFYNPVNVPLGSLQKPWPVRPGVLSRLEPRDILRAKVQTNPLSIPPGLPNQFVSVFVGHLWPVN